MKRILLVGLGLMALMMPALAAPRDDVLSGIGRCGGIPDDRAWLDCVYGAAQPMRAQLGLQPAPASQQRLVPPAVLGAPPARPVQAYNAAPAPAPPAPPRKGFFARMLSPTHEEAQPPVKMTSYKFNAAGAFIVTLANGETWEQDIGDAARAHWNKPAQTYTAQILPTASTYHYLKVGPDQYMVNKD